MRASKRSPIPTKKKKKIIIESLPREAWSRLTKWKTFKSHKKGHCKICHKTVKNLEAHIKIKHKETKI